ncbi:hypothetical protein LXL04_037643 [Taraxacum kok-saghyz]
MEAVLSARERMEYISHVDIMDYKINHFMLNCNTKSRIPNQTTNAFSLRVLSILQGYRLFSTRCFQFAVYQLILEVTNRFQENHEWKLERYDDFSNQQTHLNPSLEKKWLVGKWEEKNPSLSTLNHYQLILSPVAAPPLATEYTMSDYLCEELIVEIFTRLPPKSLLRFRSLSKLLCSCISSPIFIRMHTIRSPTKIILSHLKWKRKNKEARYFETLHGEEELPLCLCPKCKYNGIRTKAPFFRCNIHIGIIGSCNGIFCVRNENRLSLWNPSIRREVSVPELPHKPNPDTRGTWCEIIFPKPEINTRMWLAFLFDGVLHWEVFRHDKGEILTGEILTFDLSTHVFGMIPLPAHRDWITTNVTTIQGSLALISYRRKVDDTWIRLWKDDSWSVVFKLGTGQLPIDGALQLQPQPSNNCDLLFHTYGEGIQVYNSKTRERSRVFKIYDHSTLKSWRPHVETLHLIDIMETSF